MFGQVFALGTLVAAVAAIAAEPVDLAPRATSSCVSCSPPGWTALGPPAIGTSNFANMYTDLVQSVQGVHFSTKRDVGEGFLVRRAAPPPICCSQGTQCVLVVNLNIPMCYDKFTTNFLFPDNSYGTISTGNFVGGDGATANLIQGNYTSGGTTGNVYTSDPAAAPNTATLSIPAQFTGTGIGSAIAASNLGIGYSYLLSTITAPTTLPASTVSGSVVPPKTFTGPATITVSTSTFTYSTATAGATSTKKSAAGRVRAPALAVEKVLALILGFSILATFAL